MCPGRIRCAGGAFRVVWCAHTLLARVLLRRSACTASQLTRRVPRCQDSVSGAATDAEALGRELAAKLLAAGAEAIVETAKGPRPITYGKK